MGNPPAVSVSDLVALPFQWGSAIRGKRLFHPVGVLAEGFIERVAPAGEGLPISSSDIVARVSKASGTPGALPDFIGLAFRVTPSHGTGPWDILVVSSGSGMLSRALALRPAISWSGQTLTTLMPLHYRGDNWWLRARIISDIDGPGLSLDGVRKRLEHDTIQVSLDQACGRGDFTPLGRLTLTRAIDPERARDVAFDPVVNTAPGLSLHPRWLADLRARAYRRSRHGRDAD
ncbi:phosphodiesterase [Mycobacterium sp. SMC-2]|uniref:phosphodiesterase n=1 Tax=Mycobacterium sp. SMC-2 TaxID=2857058 RepID=UPI0037CC1F28